MFTSCYTSSNLPRMPRCFVTKAGWWPILKLIINRLFPCLKQYVIKTWHSLGKTRRFIYISTVAEVQMLPWLSAFYENSVTRYTRVAWDLWLIFWHPLRLDASKNNPGDGGFIPSRQRYYLRLILLFLLLHVPVVRPSSSKNIFARIYSTDRGSGVFRI
jgi:hypothetical protein